MEIVFAGDMALNKQIKLDKLIIAIVSYFD